MKRIITFVFIFIVGSSIMNSQEIDGKSTSVQHPILKDKFLFRAGLFSPFNNMTFRADGVIDTDLSEELAFDKRFGLDGVQSSFTFNFTWRFSRNYSVSADYFSVSTSKTVTFGDDIHWNGKDFDISAGIRGGYAFSLYKIFFGRVISKGEKHELGGGIGFHVVKVKGFIEGYASINNGTASFERSKVDAALPLPNIGFWYFWAPTEKWAFTARADWFGISISNISGNLWNLNPGVSYQAFEHFGVSVEYKYLNLEAEVDKESWKGNVGMVFYGPSFTVTANL